MISAILSFFGGSAFRMIWGEISSFISKKQEQDQELQRMQLQEDIEKQQHIRTIQLLEKHSELGIKTIERQSIANINETDAEAFKCAVSDRFKRSGIKWVDAWNASIRPQYAEVALILWAIKIIAQGGTMDEFDLTLCASIVGFFFADRALLKRGK
jgi:hypothetical protein